ncbi:MAG: hypothetical protein K8J08_03360 [Thermoanaerobaculia bacterium]|nr:hypothetical protein [Thermoanaerobaculia bacterium]
MRRVISYSVAPLLLNLVLVSCLASSVSAQSEARWLATSADRSATRLLVVDDKVEVRSADQPNHTVALPVGTHVEEVVATDSGWVASGIVPRDVGREILLLNASGDEAVQLTVPGGRDDLIRDTPTVLVQDGKMVGMMWLEGRDDATFRVQAADWIDGEWRHRHRVTGRGPGSQLALDATVLADGSWLAVWSRFDRQDDEIYWSRRQGGEWSDPQRVSIDNEVPDIVPSITSIGNEAYLAWSRFDGEEYRLMMARFDGEIWTDEHVVGAGGSLFPSWHHAEGSLGLVYRQAAPSAWVWMEFDAAGKARRVAITEGVGSQRPIPAVIDGASQLLFPEGQPKAVTWTALP